jgi:hypothetical protein
MASSSCFSRSWHLVMKSLTFYARVFSFDITILNYELNLLTLSSSSDFLLSKLLSLKLLSLSKASSIPIMSNFTTSKSSTCFYC